MRINMNFKFSLWVVAWMINVIKIIFILIKTKTKTQ